MSKGRDRTVSRRSDGTWENKRNDATRASSVHDTQWAARESARRMLKSQGGGELIVKGVDGKIRSKGTVEARLHSPKHFTRNSSYHVLPGLEGGWAVWREGARRVSASFKTKAAAEKWARRTLKLRSGSVYYVHGADGRVRFRHHDEP